MESEFIYRQGLSNDPTEIFEIEGGANQVQLKF